VAHAVEPRVRRGRGARQTWRGPAGDVFAYCERVGRRHRIGVPGVARFEFEAPGADVRVVPAAAADLDSVRAIYARYVHPLVLQARGTEVLHASAVAGPRGLALFCGRSGAGKSTVAFGLARRGYPVWADDAVPVDPSRADVRAEPLACEVRLRPSAAAFFALPVEHGRAVVPVAAAAEPARVAVVCALEPRLAVSTVEVERLSPARAFPLLLAHAYCFSLQDAAPKRSMLDRYLALAARVPVLAVRFHPGWDRYPALLDRLAALVTEGE
jgi:hypothetical protein